MLHRILHPAQASPEWPALCPPNQPAMGCGPSSWGWTAHLLPSSICMRPRSSAAKCCLASPAACFVSVSSILALVIPVLQGRTFAGQHRLSDPGQHLRELRIARCKVCLGVDLHASTHLAAGMHAPEKWHACIRRSCMRRPGAPPLPQPQCLTWRRTPGPRVHCELPAALMLPQTGASNA